MSAGGSGPQSESRGPLGLPRLHHRVIGSTNERARELALGGAPHGTLVTADEQTAGRGRHGRHWHSPPGRALLASVVVRPLSEHDSLLPLAAAVAVCEACEAYAGAACGIKWPNDVQIGGRKLAGVLIEGRPQEGWALVGVGINVGTTVREFPPELRGTATSLALASAQEEEASGLSPADLLPALLERLAARLEDPPESLLAAWRERDALAGQAVAWEGGRGTAAGIDDRGSLLVDTAEGRVALDSGEVHLRSGAPGGSSSRRAG
jgi:BirA family transcriptional regulator, biotin operon repressor / biotin---[acetyl-CoA-carboxylase] ligase